MEDIGLIDVKELLYTIWNKKILIIVFAILGIAVGVLYTMFLLTPMYKSSTTLILASSNSSENSTITANDLSLNSKLVSTYSEIIKSRTVADSVIKELNLNMSKAEFIKNISVNSKSGTEILEITVVNRNGKIAADIANKIPEIFDGKVKEIYNISNVSVIDVAVESKAPYNVNFVSNVVKFALIGIVLSFVIIFVTMLLDTTVKNQEDIERLLGLPVIAVIPKMDE